MSISDTSLRLWTTSHIAPPTHKVEKSCGQCGHDWTTEEVANHKLRMDHLVSVHGFKREGEQVYRSTPCIACPKPGLYKVGQIAYCKDHRALATQKRVEFGQRRSAKSDVVEEAINAREALTKSRKKLKDCKNDRKP